MKLSGIYKIESPSGRCYIGSSSSIRRRWYEHESDLRLGKHHAKGLQNACNKYGIDSLKFSVVLLCDQENLLMYEDLCMKAIKPSYNSMKFARRRDGWEVSEETRAKMSASAKARVRGPRDPSVGAKISAALKAKGIVPPGNKGKKHSEETRAKLAEKARARTEHLEAMRLTRVGHKKSPETIAKLSASMTGKKQSDETKAKRAKSITGRVVSEETKAKISAAKTGKKLPPMTEEHKAKIVAARAANRERRINEH